MGTKVNQKNSDPADAGLYFIGNRLETSLDLLGPDRKTLRQKYVIGDPRDCPAGTAKEMKARGYIGLYKRDAVVEFRIPNTNLTIQFSLRHK